MGARLGCYRARTLGQGAVGVTAIAERQSWRLGIQCPSHLAKKRMLLKLRNRFGRSQALGIPIVRISNKLISLSFSVAGLICLEFS